MRCLFLILLLAIAGCDSNSESAADEQKDPHYLNGRSRVSSQDYKGAVEEFEKALEANPRSASAHFELACLNEEQLKDYAAAIYHYQQHLRLRPNSDYADRAKDHIRACKMDLVKNEVLAPVNQGMQRDLDRLAAENLLLKRQLEALQLQLAARSNSVAAANVADAIGVVSSPRVTNSDSRNSVSRNSDPRVSLRTSARPKTHVVKSGETITSVAAKYNVKLNVFLAANPKVDPRRLKVGQVLTVPSSSQ